MIIIKADEYAVTIKDPNRLVSFPLGSFVVQKDSNEEISVVCTTTNNRYKCSLNQMVPPLTRNYKIDIPSKEDNKEGKEGDVWHAKVTSMYYLHNGTEYKATSAEHVVELFIHKLSSYLNGSSAIFDIKK
jgi:hypothetical protein